MGGSTVYVGSITPTPCGKSDILLRRKFPLTHPPNLSATIERFCVGGWSGGRGFKSNYRASQAFLTHVPSVCLRVCVHPNARVSCKGDDSVAFGKPEAVASQPGSSLLDIAFSFSGAVRASWLTQMQSGGERPGSINSSGVVCRVYHQVPTSVSPSCRYAWHATQEVMLVVHPPCILSRKVRCNDNTDLKRKREKKVE
jgi:hypothetical protein